MRNTSYDNTFITYDDDAPWLVTYADLMTLLLVFFILLYTLSVFQKEAYQQAIDTVKIKVRETDHPVSLLEFLEIPDRADTIITLEDITGLRPREMSLLDSLTRQSDFGGYQNLVDTRIFGNKVIITVDGASLFDSGSASLNISALAVFDEIIRTLSGYPDFDINIKGHTDDIPISTPVFPSNWELSAIRATTVLKYMISRGILPERLTATGYGDSMPLVPNISEENRAQNRRVEFVLEKKDGRN